MSYADWKEKMGAFKTVDVRGVAGNFFLGLKKQAMAIPQGGGMEVIQTFDPIPLYAVMEELGFEHHTEQAADNEFHAYFYRAEVKEDSGSIVMRPVALTNFPLIDEKLGNLAVDFWDLTWNNGPRTLPNNTRLLLSMANAIGAGRMRQATRELVKAYSGGVTSDELADVFELAAWNQGIGFFASEVGPSTLFKAFKSIRQKEKQGAARQEIISFLMAEFGEKNPDVKV